MSFKKRDWFLKKKISSYQRSFKKYGINSNALQWKSEKSAELRYQELMADLDFEGKTILDVGCGFGDIIPYISRKTNKFDFTGVDMVPEFIQAAQKKYPEYRFILRDYFSHPMKEKFDIVISSGTLNSNFKNVYCFRKKAIKTLFDHALEGIGFNMAGFYPQPENKESSKVYYADSLIFLKYCLSLSSKLIFRHHYHRKDFTIVIFKQEENF